MRRIYVALVMAVVFVITGCLDQGPIGPSGPLLSGSMSGYVSIRDQYGYLYSIHDSVNIKRYTASMSLIDSVKSDSVGYYNFSSASTGVYNIVFTKPGFGSAARVGFQFVGGGAVYLGRTFLSAIPTHYPTSVRDSIEVADSTTRILNYGINDTSDLARSNIIVFLGADSLVSNNPEHYAVSFTAGYTTPTRTRIGGFVVAVSEKAVAGFGFVKGDTAWVAAYGTAFNETDGVYADPVTGRTFHTCVSDSVRRSKIVIP